MKNLLALLLGLLIGMTFALAHADEPVPGTGNTGDKTNGDMSTPSYVSPYRYEPDLNSKPTMEPDAEGSGAGGKRDDVDKWLKEYPEPSTMDKELSKDLDKTTPEDTYKDTPGDTYKKTPYRDLNGY